MKPVQHYFITIGLVLGLLLCQLSSQSQSIGVWTLNNTLAGTGTPFNSVGNVSLGSAISSGAFNGGTEYYGENGWPAGALNTNAYVEFSLSPYMSSLMHMSTLTIRMRRSNTGSPAGAGPTAWAVRSSVDGFSSNISTGTVTHAYSNYILSLPAFTSLASTVTFRIYGYSATVPSGGISRLVFDNISVQGATGTLPVQFPHLSARALKNGNEIKWQAMNIQEGTRFTIEQSQNGIDFSTVGEQREANTVSAKEYSFLDAESVRGKSFYRIRAEEPSGQSYVSKIVAVESAASVTALVKKIMTSGSGADVRAELDVPVSAVYTLTIYNSAGSVLYRSDTKLQEGINNISLPMPASARGIFVLSMNKQGLISSRQFRL